ncbi:succinate dehydrogenase/fumarate reductase iron-sulfur subunit [Thermodesulfobacteriota bacterium]
MKKLIKILRFDPENDKEPYFREYELEPEPTDRILDCLNKIKWEQDGGLGYRMSCGHGVCGSDAMKINGNCGLACQKLVKDYEDSEIIIEPLPSFRVLKDLIVDIDPFLKLVSEIRPYLISNKPPPEKERKQSKKDNEKINEVIRCILCGSCTAACPVTEENGNYLGPASFVWAFRNIFDSRDDETIERLKQIDSPEGVWGCINHFECTRTCPKEIRVTKSINNIKKEIEKVLR